MIYDFRMYTLKPGAVPDYMAAVKDVALPLRLKHGIKLAGWYYSDIGCLLYTSPSPRDLSTSRMPSSA